MAEADADSVISNDDELEKFIKEMSPEPEQEQEEDKPPKEPEYDPAKDPATIWYIGSPEEEPQPLKPGQIKVSTKYSDISKFPFNKLKLQLCKELDLSVVGTTFRIVAQGTTMTEEICELKKIEERTSPTYIWHEPREKPEILGLEKKMLTKFYNKIWINERKPDEQYVHVVIVAGMPAYGVLYRLKGVESGHTRNDLMYRFDESDISEPKEELTENLDNQGGVDSGTEENFGNLKSALAET